MATKNKLHDEMVIQILVGLPGAGKSSYAAAMLDKNEKAPSLYVKPPRERYQVIDMDGILSKKRPRQSLYDLFKGYSWFSIFPRNPENVIIDGLFLSHADQYALLEAFYECSVLNPNHVDFSKLVFEFHYWEPDREACLWNDRFRREQGSNITIENVPVDEPLVEGYGNFVPNVRVIRHTTVRKSHFQFLQALAGCPDQPYMKSESWTTGGSYGNCWNDSRSNYSSDNAPAEFHKFDELIEKLVPDITFLRYKRLTAESVSIENDIERDYYDSQRHYSYFQCDLWKLYQALRQYYDIDKILESIK